MVEPTLAQRVSELERRVESLRSWLILLAGIFAVVLFREVVSYDIKEKWADQLSIVAFFLVAGAAIGWLLGLPYRRHLQTLRILEARRSALRYRVHPSIYFEIVRFLRSTGRWRCSPSCSY